MKISKLFHWLYGFVMLLPIFAIGSACLISTFNMSSKEETEIIYEYETNDVNSNNDLIVGRAYHIELNDQTIDAFATQNQSSKDFVMEFFNLNAFDFAYYQFQIDEILYGVEFNEKVRLEFTILDSFECYFTMPTHDVYYTFLIDYTLDVSNFSLSGDFVLRENNNIFNTFSIFSRCENIPIKSVESHNVNAQDVFYNSVEKVQNMQIFSWSYNSFLVQPFQYILALFGVPSNHVVVELLSYWLSISIIWLVFDVIMYVPLLVHRWLDKGVLE